MEKIEVIKFGGSSLKDPEAILRVAKIARQHRQNCQNLLVVVSAMGEATDHLVQLAKEVSPNYSDESRRREMDMLLTSGERVSMSLLSMALQDLGIESISFTGSQSGIITSNVHGNASISEIRPVRIHENLDRGKVCIVAGFQGVSPQKEVTTLGRGGSDLSAIAFGRYFKDKGFDPSVYIYSDVPGIMSADPRLIPEAKLISQIGMEHAYQASSHGANVMYHRSLLLAKDAGLSFYLKNSLAADSDGQCPEGSFFSIEEAKEKSFVLCKWNEGAELISNFEIPAPLIRDTAQSLLPINDAERLGPDLFKYSIPKISEKKHFEDLHRHLLQKLGL